MIRSSEQLVYSRAAAARVWGYPLSNPTGWGLAKGSLGNSS